MNKIRPLCFLFFVLLARIASGQTSILFVGNSFTHGQTLPVVRYNQKEVTDLNSAGYGGVPGIFKKMTVQAGLSYTVTSELASGQSLLWHLKNKAPLIAGSKWDVVVLQDLSVQPLPPPYGKAAADFPAAADALQDLVLTQNPATQVWLYETWASPTTMEKLHYTGGLPAMQSDLRKAYFTTLHRAQRTPSKPDFAGVARVGDAFMKAVDKGLAVADPIKGIPPGTFDLWGEDHRHASKYGSYLSAAIFFGKITGQDPSRLATGPGTAAADLEISPSDAQHLQALADQINAEAEPKGP